jgi:hypothetical protein
VGIRGGYHGERIGWVSGVGARGRYRGALKNIREKDRYRREVPGGYRRGVLWGVEGGCNSQTSSFIEWRHRRRLMGVVTDFYLTMEDIRELYEVLRDDDDVEKRHLYSAVLKAAREVLDTSLDQPMPHSLDLVLYALMGASAHLKDLREHWVRKKIR